ncbi:MAG: Type prenyl endopeptidase Rce1-like [Mycobacteriales bacterium]
MTTAAGRPTGWPAGRWAGRSGWAAAALLAGFAAAIGLRVTIGGPGVAGSVPAGLAFAAALTALTLAAPPRTRGPAGPALAWAAAGTAVLCAPAALSRLAAAAPAHRPTGFLPWAGVIVLVATAEEAFLRGALYDQVLAWRGPTAAVLVSTACFTALHIPLYGWHSAALNTAAGLWLAALRHHTGTWTAPALAHTATDLIAWWLR